MGKGYKAIGVGLFIIFPSFLWAGTKVTEVEGNSQYKTFGSSAWKKVYVNLSLRNGDAIRTPVSGNVVLDMDGNEITISENSSVSIAEDEDGSAKVQSMRMDYGKSLFKMNKLKKGGFKVNSITSVAAVRGTEFVALVGKNGEVVWQVEEGKVAVSGSSSTVMVEEDQETTVPLGGNPSAVRETKPREWRKWLGESESKIDGNEAKIMNECLKKMEALRKDIYDLEKIEAGLKSKAAKLKGKAALNEKRKALFAKFRISVKAGNMALVKQMADRIYGKNKSAAVAKPYKSLGTIYAKYFNKYIKDVIDARRKLEQYRNKK